MTLIEMLVVIAIIGSLSAIMLPAMSHAKAKAQSVVCISNLKQLQIGWGLYVDANSGALPPNNSEKHEFVQTGVSNAWGNSWVWGNAQHDTNTVGIESGVLFEYVKSAKPYLCPADRSTVVDSLQLRRFRGYSLDTWLNAHTQSGTIEQSINDSPSVLRMYHQLVSQPPGRVFVFIDEHPESIGDGIFGLPIPWFIPPPDPVTHEARPPDSTGNRANWWGASKPADRHSQGCNLSFADGHVEHWTWRWPKLGMPEGDVQGMANEDDLKDFRRLQEAAPKP